MVRHVRDALGLAGDVELERPAERTAKRYRELARSRMKVTYDAARVRQVAEQAIRKAVQAKGNPAGCSPLATFGGRGSNVPAVHHQKPSHGRVLAGGQPLDEVLAVDPAGDGLLDDRVRVLALVVVALDGAPSMTGAPGLPVRLPVRIPVCVRFWALARVPATASLPYAASAWRGGQPALGVV